LVLTSTGQVSLVFTCCRVAEWLLSRL